MEFLDNLVLPQSAEHIRLINYLLVLIFFLFIPYIGILLVTSILSLVYRGKGIREANPVYTEYSASLIRIPTLNKSVGVILGIIPFLTIILMIAQIMHRTDTSILEFLFASFIFGTIGIILIYTYRYSFDFENIYNRVQDKIIDEELSSILKKTSGGSSRLAAKSGLWGVITLVIGLWFLLTAVTIIYYPFLWQSDSLFLLFNWRVMLYALQFLALSSALTGAFVLFSYYYWEWGISNLNEEFSDFNKRVSIHLVFWGALALPLIMLISLFSLETQYLSGGVFAFSVIALILLFIVYNLVYGMIKTRNIKLSGPVFFLVIFIALSVIIKDQAAMSNATAQHAAVLNAEFEAYLSSLIGDRGLEEVDGKAIFDVRCSSCHVFDQRLVGPAFNNVLPKYEANRDQLVSFILNPGRIDPQFPPMPNPGLKPNEARAVSEYIMETYNQ
jgi:cytochrome c551/c552